MRFDGMKNKQYLRFLVFGIVWLLAVSTSASAQEGTVTPSGGSPTEAMFEIHHEPKDESFLIFGDEISLGGLLPVKVDYEKDYTKLQGQTLELSEMQKHGGIDYPNFIEIDGEEKEVAKGSITVEEVSPIEGQPKANVKGTYQVEFKEGGTSEGAFQLVAEVKHYGLSTLGMLLMLFSIGTVWVLAIFCYKKLLFDDN
jgi:hypothetical protein